MRSAKNPLLRPALFDSRDLLTPKPNEVMATLLQETNVLGKIELGRWIGRPPVLQVIPCVGTSQIDWSSVTVPEVMGM
jgi:hypothetical protein